MFYNGILIVDDDEGICETMQDIFMEMEYKVHYVTSGEFAIEEIKGKKYDLVLIDYRMPGMDGIETCRRIRQLLPSVAIVMITGNDMDGKDMEEVKSIANGIFYKPVDIRALVNHVSRVMVFYATAHLSGKMNDQLRVDI
jgi:DNA-binding response OmpR family regulator